MIDILKSLRRMKKIHRSILDKFEVTGHGHCKIRDWTKRWWYTTSHEVVAGRRPDWTTVSSDLRGEVDHESVDCLIERDGLGLMRMRDLKAFILVKLDHRIEPWHYKLTNRFEVRVDSGDFDSDKLFITLTKTLANLKRWRGFLDNSHVYHGEIVQDQVMYELVKYGWDDKIAGHLISVVEASGGREVSVKRLSENECRQPKHDSTCTLCEGDKFEEGDEFATPLESK